MEVSQDISKESSTGTFEEHLCIYLRKASKAITTDK